ncbi:hypothetical protein [Niabella beijingensis]|uniref:hypothetical protein n=1 Tax=Niabella beijingensis TaxID=2872700 RepID=UPI001CBA9AC0|nr:hypothetical protein [Niabella beijingensis]MBZ4187669.1 hypothetical protein [Niabella beijingensis]
MKTKFTFTIQPLLYNTPDLKGPITQVFFAKQYMEEEGAFYYNRLARLTFEKQNVHLTLPGAMPLIETLIFGEQQRNHSTLHLCIRGERTYCKVATGYFPKRIAVTHKEYEDALLMGKLTKKEIQELFAYIWDHPESIKPIDPPHSGFL